MKLRDKIKDIIVENDSRRGYYICYTTMFVIVAGFVFSWYFMNGRTMIWNVDGWSQHYKALVYYAQYLRSIIKELLFEHQLIIPSWDFSIGEGSDILQTFQYYVIGDPFAVFSVFVPTQYMYVYYDFMMVFRLYCAGLAFSALSFGTGQKSKYATLAGSLTYAFCFWGISLAVMHPFFLNPMVYFPLMVLGIEKILKRERPYLFIGTVFVSAISNFYFFYIIVLLCVIYVAVRLLFLYGKDWKSMVCTVLKIALFAIIGVAMSAIVFIPILTTFLGDQRMSVGHEFELLYPWAHYSELVGLLLGQGQSYWVHMGFAAPIFVAVCYMCLQKKKHKIYKVFLALSILFMVVPFFGQMFNGFAYMINRWSWAIALLVSYMMVVVWTELMHLKEKNVKPLLICILIYFMLCMFLEYSRTPSTMVSIILALAFLFVISPISFDGKMLGIKRKQQLTLLLTIISIIGISYYNNASSGANFAATAVQKNTVEKEFLNNETQFIKDTAEKEGVDEFYRYSGRGLTSNAGILAKLSSTQFYWSISNSTVSSFRSKMEMSEEVAYNYAGYDDRASMISLAGVRYYVKAAADKLPIPYGFTHVATCNLKNAQKEEVLEELKQELGVENLTAEQIHMVSSSNSRAFEIYRNDNVLPIAYTYTNYMKQEEWEQLNPVEKQEAMQKAIVIDDFQGEIEEANVELQSKTITPEVVCNGTNITKVGSKYIVTQANATITLSFEGIENAETYIRIKGLNFEGTPTYDLYWGGEDVDPLNLYNKANWDVIGQTAQENVRKNKLFWRPSTSSKVTFTSSLGVSKSIFYRTEANDYYNGRHNFAINLNYSEDAVNSVTVTLPQVGVYNIDSFEIICLPMEQYVSDIAELNKDVENVKIGTDKVLVKANVDSNKVMCFAIPYSTGWTAYIDGVETEVYRANERYMAIEIDEGEHKVVLKYQTPLIKLSFIISVLGFLSFVIFIIFNERKVQKNVINSNSSI